MQPLQQLMVLQKRKEKKKLKTVAGSSNDEVTNAISASAQEQNSEVMAKQEDVLSFGASGHWLSSITEEIELLVGSFHERPSINQAEEPRGDSSQPTDPLCLGHGRYYDELCMALAISASGWGGGGKCVLMYGFM